MLRSLLRSLRAPGARAVPPAPSDEFQRKLADMVAGRLQVADNDNVDLDRYFGADPDARTPTWCKATLHDLMSHGSEYAATYDLLEDAVSKAWFVQLVAYRLLGHRHIRLASNTPAHWELRARARALSKKPVERLFGVLGDYEVEFAGERIRLEAWWANVAWTFLFRQYELVRDGVRVAADPGDRVIDAGAFFGDTALAFAAAVGAGGRVLSFEIDPRNTAVARRNLERNPALAPRIRLREQALADSPAALYLHGSGPGAYVAAKPSAHPLEVTTIDLALEAGELDRVDLIKMDIEGAEQSALAGAQQALRRFRPKLAISVYHRPDHLWSIARWLDSLNLGYRFYLEHYTIHYEETVLYALA